MDDSVVRGNRVLQIIEELEKSGLPRRMKTIAEAGNMHVTVSDFR